MLQHPANQTHNPQLMGIVVPETCWASNKICKKDFFFAKTCGNQQAPCSVGTGVKRPGHEGDCSSSTQIRTYNCPWWPHVPS